MSEVLRKPDILERRNKYGDLPYRFYRHWISLKKTNLGINDNPRIIEIGGENKNFLNRYFTKVYKNDMPYRFSGSFYKNNLLYETSDEYKQYFNFQIPELQLSLLSTMFGGIDYKIEDCYEGSPYGSWRSIGTYPADFGRVRIWNSILVGDEEIMRGETIDYLTEIKNEEVRFQDVNYLKNLSKLAFVYAYVKKYAYKIILKDKSDEEIERLSDDQKNHVDKIKSKLLEKLKDGLKDFLDTGFSWKSYYKGTDNIQGIVDKCLGDKTIDVDKLFGAYVDKVLKSKEEQKDERLRLQKEKEDRKLKRREKTKRITKGFIKILLTPAQKLASIVKIGTENVSYIYDNILYRINNTRYDRAKQREEEKRKRQEETEKNKAHNDTNETLQK